MVHLSELKGPLPDAAEAKEEESSESTLTEANNGIDKPATNPSQVSMDRGSMVDLSALKT